MSNIFNTLLYQPIFNLLIFFYNIIPGHDIGLAIILLTILIRIILWPLSAKSLKSQKSLQSLQPKLEELKRKYKDKKEELAKATMEFYRQEKVNPFSSCLPVLIQLPFLIAVFQVFRDGFRQENLKMLYFFVDNPGAINPLSLGLVDLSQPNTILAGLAGLAQFWQVKMMITKKQPKVSGSQDENMMVAMNKQMIYFMPIVTIVFGLSMPGGLTLYWFVTTVLMALQQIYFFKKKDDQETIIA